MATATHRAPAYGRRPVAIVPSVLPADFAVLGKELAALEAAGADCVGATALVAGSALFGHPAGLAAAIRDLRASVGAAEARTA